MAEANTFIIKPLAFRAAVEGWFKLAALFAGHANHVQAQFTANIDILTASATCGPSDLSAHPQVARLREASSVEGLPAECINFHVTIANSPNPQQQQQPLRVAYAPPQGPHGPRIQFQGLTAHPRALEFLTRVGELFSFVPEFVLPATTLPAVQQESIQFHERVVAQLGSEVAKIADFNRKLAEDHAKFLEDATTQLQERWNAQVAELERKRAALEEVTAAKQAENEAKHSSLLAALEEREAEHKRRVAEHDARENMVVRRELLHRMVGELDQEKEFELSKATGRKRMIVHALCASALLAAAALVVAAVVHAARTTELRFPDVAPISVGAVLFASTLVYYLRWNDQWFRQHADAELRNKKLHSDILRASWLAELTFEGTGKERVLPEALIARFSEGLFTDLAPTATEHPVDQMAELLRKVSSIKVDKDGIEVTKTAAKE